ncbi:MAG TPA: hypothetical protein VE198_13115 [Actinoallomurus sp.]|nr:hypothetical protein [Actinoallomurus sp.]
MAFDFSVPERVAEWRTRIAAFVAETVTPLEQRAFTNGWTGSCGRSCRRRKYLEPAGRREHPHRSGSPRRG